GLAFKLVSLRCETKRGQVVRQPMRGQSFPVAESSPKRLLEPVQRLYKRARLDRLRLVLAVDLAVEDPADVREKSDHEVACVVVGKSQRQRGTTSALRPLPTSSFSNREQR